jgi:hypothetical protein
MLIVGSPGGLLPAGLAGATTIVGEDVDGGPLGGGGLPVGLEVATTVVGEDVDGGTWPPLGVLIPSVV